VILLASKYYSVMRKSYFLLIPLLIWGCEKTYDNLIDTSRIISGKLFIRNKRLMKENPEDSTTTMTLPQGV
jgi:hypothetical protein